jgi:hypothetical protein
LNPLFYIFRKGIAKNMKIISFFLLLVSIFMVMGCVNPANSPATPIGKGYLNLCISNPTHADYWQKTEDVLWNIPGGASEKNSTIITRFLTCDNSTATIWEYKPIGDETWNRITIHTIDGRAWDGWLPASHITGMINETGTEWSENYSSIVGRWDQTQRGNGPKIWYEFTPDGAYTYNYDMMGNKENIQDRGNWVYPGNKTYDLISNTYSDHRHISIVVDRVARSFSYGTEYSSGSDVGTKKIFSME